MAGGSNPRQKMINLMYLVLIAMLALNVDTKVLKKFLLINQSFEATNSEKVVDNTRKIESIRAAVDDSGNRQEDIDVLNLSEEIRNRSNTLVNYLGDIKTIIVEETGGSDGKGGIKGYKNTDYVYRYMNVDIDDDGKLNGDEIQIMLNDFSNFVQDSIFLGDENSGVVDLARNADQIPLYDDAPPTDPSFRSLNFGFGTSAGAGLATISQLQSEIINLEIKALDKLAANVGAADLKFDVVSLTTLPEQKVVAAGAKYRTQLFLSAASSAIVPTMTAGGDTLEVSNGRGYYEFTAQGGGYNSEGLAEKQYIGSISVTLPGGRDTTFVDTVKYFVARPVIQIQSASVQALYLNCGNEIQINVPALGSEYNPSFSASGGDVIRGNRPGQITIVPNSQAVDLKVSNAGNLLGTEKFKVKNIPAPNVVVTTGQGCRQNNYPCTPAVDLERGIKANVSRINLDVIADQSFSEFLPKDSQFIVREASALLVRGGRAIGGRKTIRGRTMNLTQLFPTRQAGDDIKITISKVARANFRNEVEDFKNFTNNFISVSITN